MIPHSRTSPLSATELVDEYFIENRTKLLDIAAFLDRLDRADPAAASADFRMRAFTEAVAVLAATGPGGGDRVGAVQLLFSDPTSDPLDTLDRKGAVGAFDRTSRRDAPGSGHPDRTGAAPQRSRS